MDFAHAWRRMTVYAVVFDDGVRHWRYTLRPHVDAAYWRRQGAHAMVPLEPPAPAMWAEYACRLLQRLEDPQGAVWPWGIGLSAVTVVMLGMAGWLGGKMVFEHNLGPGEPLREAPDHLQDGD
ncbi:MAG: DUF2231 domain-containing protein [Limnochordales bacterium]